MLRLAGAVPLVALLLAAVSEGHTGHVVPVNPNPAPAQPGWFQNFVGFWDNYGNYMPRSHCLLKADGTPDWPWIGIVSALCAGVVIGYYRIYIFWRRNYLAEAPRDRNRKLMDLAQIFLWCSICGYAMSIVMFVWPAYRLLAVFLVILNIFTYRFAANLSALTVSLSAIRLKRELEETLANRAAELERLVEERTLELQRARAAAIAADEAKTEFLANMSHEIRTPMTAILGFTDLLDNPKLDPATRSKHLRTVRESGRHLLAVVNDILDLARIEANRLRIDRVNCDVHALLQDSVALLQPRAADRKLTLSLNIEPAAPRVVQTDPTRLRQIVLNLIGNAIKFTEVGSVAVDYRVDPTDASRFTIAVIDTGVGMDGAQLAKLFQRFNQLNASKYAGSGLGLVISKHLTKLLGGDLTVESEAGVGSKFVVSLPATPAPAQVDGQTNGDGVAHANGDGAAQPGRNGHIDGKAPTASMFNGLNLPSPLRESERRQLAREAAAANGTPASPPLVFAPDTHVLLVDDGDENRQLVQYLLEQNGITVEIAEDGQVALDRVEAQPQRFDLVLMDIQMPRLDGYAATTTLRTRQFTRPIVALTANTMTGDRERCLKAGCDAYISKPIDTDLLLRTVHDLLQRDAAQKV